MKEFNAVVFEKADLEYRDILIALLPLLANYKSNSDLENKFYDI